MNYKHNIAIFASGNGTNAINILRNAGGIYSVKYIVTNNENANVVKKAKDHNIEILVVDIDNKKEIQKLKRSFKKNWVELIVLAGFLKKIPIELIDEYPDRILNIHPSLLPNYGGKGMYGLKVHEKVIASGENTSGITIHLVNKEYDKGKVIFQKKLTLPPEINTAEKLEKTIKNLEFEWYPEIIKQYLKRLNCNG